MTWNTFHTVLNLVLFAAAMMMIAFVAFQ